MAQVEITVNGREYRIACDDGQEERLTMLAAHFNQNVTSLAAELGQIGDARLMLLSALTLCDELFDARNRLSELENADTPLDSETAGAAGKAIEAAVARVREIADQIEAQ